jgi:hypothetical protein
MILALLLCLQETVDLKEFRSAYTLVKPADYTDQRSWPVVLDLGRPKDPAREPQCFVLTPGERRGDDFLLACVMDLKTRYRIDPERVIVRGGVEALSLAANNDDLFAACALRRPQFAGGVKKAPPCVLFLSPTDPDRMKLIVQAGLLKRAGIRIEVRDSTSEPGEITDAIVSQLHPRADAMAALDLQQQGRWLDSSLLCIDLLEKAGPGQQAARTLLKNVEGRAIIELAKVEVAMSERQYKDAVLRCRNAARQFAWVPQGEKIRKRLAELESRPDVKKALETDD